MSERKIYILIVAIILGVFITTQIRSFLSINDLLVRDTQSNPFQEIQILRHNNEDLTSEIKDLETSLDKLQDQNQALGAIEKEINKYKKMSGDYGVYGPGMSITIEGNISTEWLVDIVNEALNVGAEAITINGIRTTNKTGGLDTLPQGQILLNGSILNSPYLVEVIGDGELIESALDLPGGIFDRIQNAFPETKLVVVGKDFIQMD